MASFSLEIQNMNIQEKFSVMEEIWNSLDNQDLKEFTPNWHLDILEKRENQTDFIDIEKSKKVLKKLLK